MDAGNSPTSDPEWNFPQCCKPSFQKSNQNYNLSAINFNFSFFFFKLSNQIYNSSSCQKKMLFNNSSTFKNKCYLLILSTKIEWFAFRAWNRFNRAHITWFLENIRYVWKQRTRYTDIEFHLKKEIPYRDLLLGRRVWNWPCGRMATWAEHRTRLARFWCKSTREILHPTHYHWKTAKPVT